MHCPGCQHSNPSSRTTCELCGAALAQHSSVPPAPPDTLSPERREATVLFADLGNYTEWNAQADVEEVVAVMDAIKAGAADIVGAYGGFVNQFVGDEVMAVFGIPEANDDDPLRAVRAALELRALLASERIVGLLGSGPRLTFHMGIDTGLVLARRRDIRDGVYDMTGSTVNLAARLRSQAAADEILVSDATHARVGEFCEHETLPPRRVKGVPGEVRPHRILRLGLARTHFDIALARGLTAYVGRSEELAKLAGFLDEAARGEARLVAVEGPPGVGKTRLMHELVQLARGKGFAVLRGHCQGYGNIPPFQPFLETLADALGADARTRDGAAKAIARAKALGPEVEAHLPVYLYLLSLDSKEHPLPPELSGQGLRRAVIDALGTILVRLAAKRPVLVVVEDWHWADEASDALFRELARATLGQRVLAAVTYRQEQLAPARRPLSNRQIRLGHFGSEGTERLLSGLLQSETLPPALVDFVHAATDGNPFFVEEVCHALIDTGALVGGPGAWRLSRARSELETPESVHAVVRARIDRLAAADRELLKLASVIGSVFSVDLLDELSEQELSPDESLARLEARAHVLNLEPRTYRFKHAIVQEVVYNVLLLRRRRKLHGRLGERIEARFRDVGLEPHYEALAHHFDNSDFGDKAVYYGELAGRKAERSASLEDARRHYLRAVQRLDEMPPSAERKKRRLSLSLRWASVLVHDPDPRHRQVLHRSLDYAEELGDRSAAARCLCWMGWIEYSLGNQPDAIALNERALAIAEELGDQGLRVQVRANIGLSHVMACDYERALSCFAVLDAEATPWQGERADGVGHIASAAAGYGYAVSHQAIIAADRGDFVGAEDLMQRAHAAVEASGRLAMRGAMQTVSGLLCSFHGDFERCKATVRHNREIAGRIDSAYQTQMAEGLEGYCRFHGEGDREGIEQMRAAAFFLERRGIGLTLSWSFACLAEALALVGQHEEALAHAQTALSRRESGDALGEATALRASAIARAASGGDAEPDLRASLAVAVRKQSPREEAMTYLRWAQLHGDARQRRTLAARALELFERLGMKHYAARARALASA